MMNAMFISPQYWTTEAVKGWRAILPVDYVVQRSIDMGYLSPETIIAKMLPHNAKSIKS